MPENDKPKTSLTQIRDAFGRAVSTKNRLEQKIERTAGVVAKGLTSLAVGGVHGGFAQKFGERDDLTGVKRMSLGGVNVAWLGAAAGLGADLLEAGGKYSDLVGQAGNSFMALASDFEARRFVENLERRAAQRSQRQAAQPPAQIASPVNGATSAVTSPPVAVAVGS